MTTSVDIPEGLEKALEDELERGYYASKSDLIRDALRKLLEERQMLERKKLPEETIESINKARKQQKEDYKSLEEIKNKYKTE